MVYSQQTCSYWFFEKIVSAAAFLTFTPPSTLNMWEYEWELVCVRERCMCLFVFENMSNLCEHAGVKARKWAARGWERVNEGLSFMQSPYYSVNTQSGSLHIREQNSSEILPLGVIQLPFPHTHIQRQWLLLSETEMHYVLSLTLSTTYSHKTARMNTQLHGDSSETSLNQRRWPNTTRWVAQIYTWYLLSCRSVEFLRLWVVHTDSDFNRWGRQVTSRHDYLWVPYCY